ncbi:MAG: type II toxin-antitoxin system Phd/YefM family antitoxin [Victivallales bacterium]
MVRMLLDKDIRPLSDFRAGAAGCIRQVHDTKRPMVITQRGRGVAVLIDIKEFELLQERAELLQDIDTAEKQIREGKVHPHSEVMALVLNHK